MFSGQLAVVRVSFGAFRIGWMLLIGEGLPRRGRSEAPDTPRCSSLQGLVTRDYRDPTAGTRPRPLPTPYTFGVTTRDSFDDEPTRIEQDAEPDVVWSEDIPSVIGPYRLLSRLGSGGMGEVFLAEQTEPVQRKVAIKLVHRARGQPIGRAMFEVECAMLARMHHPYIAQVLDAGETDDGRPWFAMEWVRGEPILAYCNQHDLDRAGRLSLFLRVCQGVQHAHQRGVLHRDLKPANILVSEVDGRALPKIIDFGVATSLLEEGQSDRATQTDRAGTRAYMSPEQLAGDAASLDTRTDVYALGILLFELLTGLRPLADSSRAALSSFCELLQTRSIIPEKPTPEPTFSAEAAAAARRLPEELRWIVARAIAPDRERRYASAAALADEVARHLNNQRVEAVPPSLSYRWRKFFSRNRLPVAAGGMVAVALVGGLLLASWGLTQARAERDRAQVEAERAARTASFVQNIFRSVDPVWAEGFDTALLRQLLDQAAERSASELAGQPQVLADIQYTIAAAYRAIGQNDIAREQMRSAARLSETHGPRDLHLAALTELAHLDVLEARYEQGLDSVRRTLEQMRSEAPDEAYLLIAALTVKASALQQLQRYEQAETLLLEAETLTAGAVDDAVIEERLQALRILAQVYSDDFRFDQAQARYEQVLAELAGWDDPRALSSEISALNDLAVLHLRQQQYAEAEPWLRRALAMGEELYGPDHPAILPPIGNLAGSLRQQGRAEEALPYYERARAGIHALHGPEHPRGMTADYNLANCLRDLGRTDEALALHRSALERVLRLSPDNRFLIGMFQLGLGRTALDAGELAEATEALAGAVADLEATAGADFHRTIEAREHLEQAADRLASGDGSREFEPEG
ncbi:MAG: hypothetical protein EA419_10625 [Wenzhouxiangella sp.]|nr:MAG: hypothetical protein EA419_10625 [Wenzhouxiangella sp.]